MRLEPADPPACPEAVAAVARRRLGGARPGLVVHQRDPAPAGPRAARRRWSRPPARRCVVLNLEPQAGETDGLLARTTTSRCSPSTPPTCGSTSCSPTAARVGDRATGSSAAARRSAPSWWSPTSPLGDGTPRHDPVKLADAYAGSSRGMSAAVSRTRGDGDVTTWQDRTHGDDGTGEGRAGQHAGHEDLLPQGRGLLDAAVRRRPAHRQRPDRGRGRAGHRRRRPSAAQRHRRGLRPPLRRRDGRRATASARAAATSSASSRTARRWPARPGCSTGAAARSAACRRRSSPAPAATPSPPGAARSWPTARSPSPAAPRPSRSPAPAPRPRSRSSARPAGSASRPRPARSAASTAS